MSPMPCTKLHAENHESFSEQAYLAIRDRILHGKLTLGSVLSRRKLAAELGMSLLPVCAAIQRLADDGILESKPRVGTRVRIPTEQDIRERYIIREALETQAARLVAEKANLQQRQELVHMAEQLDALNRRTAVDQDAEFRFTVQGYHMQLHLRIAEYSGASALRELIEKNSVLIFNWLFDLFAPPAPLPLRFHRDLLDAVTGTDVEMAERKMREHIQYGEEDTVRSFAQARSTSNSKRRWRLRGAPDEAHLLRVDSTADGQALDYHSMPEV